MGQALHALSIDSMSVEDRIVAAMNHSQFGNIHPVTPCLYLVKI